MSARHSPEFAAGQHRPKLPHRHRGVESRSLLAAGTLGFSRTVRLLLGVAAVLTLVGVGVSGGLATPSRTAARTVADFVTIYPSGYRPSGAEDSDRQSVELGVRFGVNKPGRITAIKFYKTVRNVGVHTASLWTATGRRLAGGTVARESKTGWQTLALARPVKVWPHRRYIASYHAPRGHYAETLAEFDKHRKGNRDIFATTGVYAYGATTRMPRSTWERSGYGVDVEFRPAGAPVAPPVGPSASGTNSSVPAPPSSSAASPTATASSSASQPAPITSPPAPTSSPTGPPGKLPDLTSYPNASNTGVPAGTKLLAVPQDVSSGSGWHWDSRGWVVIDGDGTTFSGFQVTRGAIEVYAAGVTIKNNDVLNDGNAWAVGIRPGASGTVVEDNDLHGPCLHCADRLTYGVAGFLGGDTSRSRIIGNDLYNIDHPLQQESGLIQDNYVHDLAALPSGSDHVDAFFSGGGGTDQLTVDHNTLLNDFTGDGSTASVMLNNAFGVQSNRLIENNLVAGGGFTIYGGSGPPIGSNVVIRNNEFSTAYFPKGGYYGAVVYLLPAANENSFTGNTWADGPSAGKPVSR